MINFVPHIKANNYMSGMSNGEGGLETIQEDKEPDDDQQTIEVCTR